MEDNIVKCVPLSDIDSFSMSDISIENLKLLYKEGFILTEIENNIYSFERKYYPNNPTIVKLLFN